MSEIADREMIEGETELINEFKEIIYWLKYWDKVSSRLIPSCDDKSPVVDIAVIIIIRRYVFLLFLSAI